MAHILGRAGIPMVLVARRGERLQALAQQYPNVEVLVADLLRDVVAAQPAGVGAAHARQDVPGSSP